LKNSPLKNDSGAYAIVLSLSRNREIQISRLGRFVFKKGFYVYSGSARKNLLKRVERHLRKDDKKLKWHIDYFINDKYVKVRDCFLYINGDECKVNRSFQDEGGKIVVKKFGASDCKNKCISHFLYLGVKYV
jgi:Uri superfamily endonuclease